MKKLISGFLLFGAVSGVILCAGEIRCVSHRGEEFAAPEASRPAFEKAMQARADIIKLDVRATADGELVICHDDTLKRIMNWAVPVKDLSLAQIKENGRFLPCGGYENEKLLTLQEALALVKTAPEFWLDPKDKSERTVDLAVAAMLGAGIRQEQIMLASFSDGILRYAQEKYPAIRRVKHVILRPISSGKYQGKIFGNFKPHTLNDAQSAAAALLAERKHLGLFGVNLPQKAFRQGLFGRDELQSLRQNGLWCAVYFVHDAAAAEFCGKLEPDAFVTGDIGKVRPYCRKNKP